MTKFQYNKTVDVMSEKPTGVPPILQSWLSSALWSRNPSTHRFKANKYHVIIHNYKESIESTFHQPESRRER
jgi:hypothetical protein